MTQSVRKKKEMARCFLLYRCGKDQGKRMERDKMLCERDSNCTCFGQSGPNKRPVY